MTFQHAAHFVVAHGVQFVVGHWCGLGVEAVERHRPVRVVQLGDVKRVGVVVHQHRRVAAKLSKVDYVVVHVLVV